VSTAHRRLTALNSSLPGDCSRFRIGIVVAEWNPDITGMLLEGCVKELLNAGVLDINISVQNVPGTFELSLGAQYLALNENIDAVVCLGCVVQGETRHFDFICNAAAHGITEVALKHNKPVIFGVLTTINMEQAHDRAGGRYGNKGAESGITALKMIALQQAARN
jgi:6,7-dimethyl-8-ribityllumazine synthase